MKSIKIFLALVFATALFSGYAAKAPAAGKTAKPAKLLKEDLLAQKGIILTYPGWKLKALTFSYDDANIADRRLVGIFNKYNLKGTFHIPSAWLKTKPVKRIQEKEIKNLYAGHEISGHGANHLNMASLKPDRMAQELDSDIAEWQRITGKKIRGYAFPYGRYNTELLKLLKERGILYARPVFRRKDFNLPGNFLLWASQAHHNSGIDKWADKYLSFKPAKLSVLLIWGHSYEFSQKNNWEVIEKFCEKMSGRKDIFYATMADIAAYVTAARTLEISADGKSMKNISGEKIFFIFKGKKLTVAPGAAFRF